MFGVFRKLERRETNLTRGNGCQEYSVYFVQVTRVVVLWLTVWTYEGEVQD